MIFLLDAGNTRIKWALADGGQWLDRGALSLAEVGELVTGGCTGGVNGRF